MENSEVQPFIDDELVHKIKTIIRNNPTITHINILISIMENMETLKVNGSTKKQLTISVYEKVLRDMDMYIEENDLVEQTIDIIVSLTRGKYNINQKASLLHCLYALKNCYRK